MNVIKEVNKLQQNPAAIQARGGYLSIRVGKATIEYLEKDLGFKTNNVTYSDGYMSLHIGW